MPTIEDILSNPASCCLYLNHRFYYAIGNTPSVDLTEGCEVPEDVLFLLLGCGDIRSILQTVVEVNKLKLIPRSLTFHIDDIDDVLPARNAVLIQLVNTIDPDKQEDLEFIWNVWYNLQLSEQHFQRLRSVLSDTLENPQRCLQFETEHCLSTINTVVKYWLKKKISVGELQSLREIFIRKNVAYYRKTSLEDVQFSEACEEKFKTSRFYIDSYDDSQPLKAEKITEEVKAYFRTGSTNRQMSNSCSNSTFLCPHVDGWRVHPGSLPYEGFNDLMFDENLSMTENSIRQLQGQLKSWTAYRRNGGVINVCLWNEDALTLCNRGMPPDMKFHFINTSNLCDHIGLLNVLLACSKRLKRQGILTVQTMNWCKGEYGSIENYLHEETGIISSYFYPTFLGLYLAENFELGISKRPKPFLSSAVNSLELRWTAAEICIPGIDVSDSPEIVKILEKVSKLCFKVQDPTNQTLDSFRTRWNTPLTLVYLIKQLATNVYGGVKPLLDIVERCLPRRVTQAGEQFCPLEQEWKMLKHFHLHDELDVELDDALIEVQIPAEHFTDLRKPASMGLIHRAVLIKCRTELSAFFQVQYTSPWTLLSTLHYDYETGILTFALPKSGHALLIDGSYLQLLIENSPPFLVPSGPLNEADIRTVELDVTRKTKEEKHDNDIEEQYGISVTLRETKSAYTLTFGTAGQTFNVQSFKVQVDSVTNTAVDIILEIRNEHKVNTAEKQICLSCRIESPVRKQYSGKDTVTLIKSKYFDKGSLILPLRRVAISEFPRYAAGKNKCYSLVELMFTSEKDLKFKAKDIECQSPFLQVRETIQLIFNWAMDPPSQKPLVEVYKIGATSVLDLGQERRYSSKVKAYRVKKKNRSADQLCGYFPEDMFIGVRNMYDVQGIPTLDVVWLDFECYRDLVPISMGIMYCPDALMFLEANGGLEQDTVHTLTVSLEEAILLKKILRMNTSRSVQRSDEKGSPRWRFNSFIQPVYSVTAEIEIIRGLQNLSLAERDSQTSAARSIVSNDMTGQQDICHNCLQVTFDAKKCASCKSVSYCSKECQRQDWKAGHKFICRTSKLVKDRVRQDETQQHQETETKLHTCGFCGTCRSGMKRCKRCKAVFYCSKDCQEKDWKTAHNLACRDFKSDVKGKH